MSDIRPSTTLGSALRRLYFVRFGFTVVWAALLFLTGGTMGPFLTILLIAYPLFDAASVFWQIRAEGASRRAKVSEWINVVVSVLVAVTLGWASTVSPATALTVWGVWAIGAGLPQLITAIRNRRSGGQVPQMLSGGISLFAGAAFVAQGLQGSGMITGVAGYALLGAVFFLISAIRLSVLLKKQVAA
ncbi:hypothetical protein [Microbacterium sp. CR_7]|uniref:hypothetical protein n=1 Tax=Microbacterium sp. CR_7 TaxID=3055792 RepID=UPI0035C0EC69